MKKVIISRLFLYKHRFGIGYIILATLLMLTIFFLPMLTPDGLSEAEMQSAITSDQTSFSSVMNGNLVDLPYHLAQHYAIQFFGLNAYAIKLPSIILGVVLAVLLILLLNRWFKNNVALLASILTVLSPPFLYLAGSGTPLIMVVFWPTLLLWLGSKIQGEGKPNAMYCFLFAFILLFSLFTPHMIYLAGLILIFVLFQPHLRHVVKTLPRIPFLLISLVIILGVTGIFLAAMHSRENLTALLLMDDFSLEKFGNNFLVAVKPLYSWMGDSEPSLFLSPLVGLPLVTLAMTGLFSSARAFFASRNSIATLLLVYTALVAGLRPDAVVLIILPVAILVAHGFRFILNLWYGLFPENPYARIFAIFPLGVILGVMLFSDISNFVFGYRYNPSVANQFNTDLALVNTHLEDGATLLVPKDTTEYDFFKILEKGKKHLSVTDELSNFNGNQLASLRKWEGKTDNFTINRIITSPKSQESDRIYIYSVNQDKKE